MDAPAQKEVQTDESDLIDQTDESDSVNQTDESDIMDLEEESKIASLTEDAMMLASTDLLQTTGGWIGSEDLQSGGETDTLMDEETDQKDQKDETDQTDGEKNETDETDKKNETDETDETDEKNETDETDEKNETDETKDEKNETDEKNKSELNEIGNLKLKKSRSRTWERIFGCFEWNWKAVERDMQENKVAPIAAHLAVTTSLFNMMCPSISASLIPSVSDNRAYDKV
ncbi:hypothetical protein NOR_05250 [Metarhizium rileyi]|uniref:Uncharacterized protein n=1 Tax=Metarhizium rileyi (strain RCEF 4871) TaxID=1649241 RepID=A0A167CYT5_METRR|nr:hypothetical protein NOR_05250 [Metarhizium rileyi RCEF 4871]